MACAWHRQVRLASLAAAKHTPRKSKQRNDRKTKSKARRRGAVPANPLGGSAAAFSAAQCFLSLALFPFHVPLEFAFSVGYGSIVPRGRQRSQNRRLKHLYKDFESRVSKVSCSALFLVYKPFYTPLTQRFWLCPVDFRRPTENLLSSHRPMHLRLLPEKGKYKYSRKREKQRC